MKPTLLILAAGMGSRYGSLKQLDGLGPSNETIIDYSVYDAIRAGFGRVVFVIREHFAKEFESRITQQFADKIEVRFVFQEVDTPVEGISRLPERQKPWGTAHAVLMAANVIDEPFAAINADDYYGRDAFDKMAGFLSTHVAPDHFAMVGFRLGKTLSDNGSVSRGICTMDEQQYLQSVVERTKIERSESRIYYQEEEQRYPLPADSLVSMNFWGFHPVIFKDIRSRFVQFVKENEQRPKAEFYIPLMVNELMKSEKAKVRVLNSDERWYGVTYKEDKETVQRALAAMAAAGKYPKPLWQVAHVS